MKKIFLICFIGFHIVGCDKIFVGNFDGFSSSFSGIYKAEYYKTSGGQAVYFDSTNRIVLYVQNGNNEIIMKKGDRVVEKLVDVLADRNRKKQRNNTVIKYGTNSSGGGKVSVRMTQMDNFGERNTLMYTSNFISGDYAVSKDTVDIYYSRYSE